MAEDVIPQDAQQFILEHINCIAQLEAVLLLRANPQANWNAETVSGRLYIDPKQAQEVLDGLVRQGFITAHDLSYHYDPHTQEMRNMMERIVELYARYLVPVTHLIHSKSKSRVQEFADAFRIRKD